MTQAASLNDPRAAMLASARYDYLSMLRRVILELGVDDNVVVAGFVDLAGRSFDELAAASERPGHMRATGLTASRISLVHEEDLSLTLALAALKRQVRDTCGHELVELTLRFQTLLDRAEMTPEQCPVGPDGLGPAVQRLIDMLGFSAEQQRKLIERMGRPLAVGMQRLCESLNALFAAEGVEPRPLAAVRGAEAAVITRTAPAGRTGEAGLQAILQRQRTIVDPSEAQTLDPSLAAAIQERVLAWLSERQREDGAATARLAGSGLAPLLPTETAAALEAVEMVFDAIDALDDLQPAVRTLVRRLQIPYLRLALVDSGLLYGDKHPARQLLDGIVAMGATVAPGEPGETVLHALGDLVQGLQSPQASGIEAFSRSLEALEQLRGERNRRAEVISRQHAEAAGRAERRESAVLFALASLQASLLDHTLPAIRNFIEVWWVQVVARAVYSFGEDDERVRELVGLAGQLVHAGDEWARGEAALVGSKALSEVVAGLHTGLETLGLDKAACSRVLASSLAAIVAVRTGKLPAPEAVRRVSGPVISEISGGRSLRLLHHQGEANIRAAAQSLAAIELGRWVSLTLPGGETFVGVVTWVGAAGRVYMLVDPDRTAPLAVSRRALAQLAGEGACRILEVGSVVERVTTALLARLTQRGSR